MLTCSQTTSPDGAINGDIQANRELLTELREAYRSLPRQLLADVTQVLSALTREQAAQAYVRSSNEAAPEVTARILGGSTSRAG